MTIARNQVRQAAELQRAWKYMFEKPYSSEELWKEWQSSTRRSANWRVREFWARSENNESSGECVVVLVEADDEVKWLSAIIDTKNNSVKVVDRSPNPNFHSRNLIRVFSENP